MRGNGRYLEAACAPVVAEGDAVLDVIRARIAARAAASVPPVAAPQDAGRPALMPIPSRASSPAGARRS
jgi:hypothetical protein